MPSTVPGRSTAHVTRGGRSTPGNATGKGSSVRGHEPARPAVGGQAGVATTGYGRSCAQVAAGVSGSTP
jgi:hypothetical protein